MLLSPQNIQEYDTAAKTCETLTVPMLLRGISTFCWPAQHKLFYTSRARSALTEVAGIETIAFLPHLPGDSQFTLEPCVVYRCSHRQGPREESREADNPVDPVHLGGDGTAKSFNQGRHISTPPGSCHRQWHSRSIGCRTNHNNTQRFLAYTCAREKEMLVLTILNRIVCGGILNFQGSMR